MCARAFVRTGVRACVRECVRVWCVCVGGCVGVCGCCLTVLYRCRKSASSFCPRHQTAALSVTSKAPKASVLKGELAEKR